jgi:hypothetical protein
MAQTYRAASGTGLQYGSKLTSTREKLHAKGVPQDAIFEAIPTLNLMRTKGGIKKKTSGGEVIRVNVMTDKNILGKSVTGLEAVTMGQTDPFTIAYAEWKEYIWPLVISGMLKFQNQGEEKIFDLLSELEQNLYMSAAEQINADLWDAANVSTANGTSGNSGKNISSIPMAAVPVPATTNIFQGITQTSTSNLWWQNRIADGGGSLTKDTFVSKLDNLVNKCNRGRTSGKADQIVFDQVSYELFESSFRDRVRYTSDKASAGFDTINHKGCDIMWDVYVPNVKTTAENGGPAVTLTKGSGYVLNSKAIHLYMGKDFEPTPFMEGTYNGQDGMASLTIFIGQLVVSSRRNLGCFFDIPLTLS